MHDEKVDRVDETSKEILSLLHRDYEEDNDIAVIFTTLIHTTALVFDNLFESNPDKTDKEKRKRVELFIATLNKAIERQTGIILNDD